MKRLVVVFALAASGCGIMTMTPATYMVSQDARAALQKYSGSRLAVGEIANPPAFDPMCRAVGKVTIDDNLSLGQFVAKGFNDELKFAGMHGDGGARLSGALTKVAFSSSAGVTGGWWAIALRLQSSNGASMAVEHKYEFEAGFVGDSACNNVSRAFGPAVQQLVYKSITDPRFAGLLR
jgi:hypothetical protein